jgi:asparagine synthase (glutamine-hydrolysing)
MCGFAGVAAISQRWLVDAPALVERMRGELVHRGPDGSGQWGDDNVILGHQRLSILDVTDAGSQPMFSGSKRFVIAFNGEIYNFKELAERLAETGWTSVSASDTEVLIECIERWGLEATLDRVDGMFAFALYDRQRQELILCRDRFGEKPLYYGVQNGVVYFASELRSFDVPGGPELLLNRQATAAYFRYGFISAPLSIYHGFFKVRPATMIRIDLKAGGFAERSELPSHTYWSIPGPSDGAASSDEELRHVLRQSVTRRLVSDRPVGAFLSGGIDSSLTCALAAEGMSGSLKTFNMSWAEKEHDESEQAAKVASAIGAVHQRVEMSISEAASVINEVGRIVDEPNADGSLIGMYLVAREARKHFVVALSGDGGDEMFGGYNRHLWLIRTANMRRRFPDWSRPRMSSTLQRRSSTIGRLSRPIPLSKRPRLVADKMNKLGRALGETSVKGAYETVLAGNPAIAGEIALPQNVMTALESSDRSVALWGLRAADLVSYLPDDILAKVDRASMAVSLETRTAYLSRDVAQIAMNMPYGDLIDGADGKLPLRNFVGDLLPQCNFAMPKTGFGTPYASLMAGPAQDLVEISLSTFMSRELPAELKNVDWEKMYEQFRQGDDTLAFRIWSVVVFELWAGSLEHEIRWCQP